MLSSACRNKVQTLRKTSEDAEAEDYKACVEYFVQCGWSEADFEGSTVEGADVQMAALLARVAAAAAGASNAGAPECVDAAIIAACRCSTVSCCVSSSIHPRMYSNVP